MKQLRRFALSGAAGAAGVLFLQSLGRFARERDADRARMEADARVIDTAAGPVEAAIAGSGSPVLVFHGGAGGHDQGMLVARMAGLLPHYRVIAPSRPGYLRTPLATGRSAAEQADAFAALLDALEVPQAIIIGVSAGGLPALEFALRHPDRCRALACVSAISGEIPPPEVAPLLMTIGGMDFLMWFLTHAMWRMVVATNGPIPLTVWRDAERIAHLREMAEQTGTLASERLAGMHNDLVNLGPAHMPDLAAVRAPTLVIHGRRDRTVPLSSGEAIYHSVPGARMLTVRDGGHMSLFTHEAARAALRDFLAETDDVS